MKPLPEELFGAETAILDIELEIVGYIEMVMDVTNDPLVEEGPHVFCLEIPAPARDRVADE